MKKETNFLIVKPSDDPFIHNHLYGYDTANVMSTYHPSKNPKHPYFTALDESSQMALCMSALNNGAFCVSGRLQLVDYLRISWQKFSICSYP